MLKRYLTPAVLDDLQTKMVFVAGPRQVGKTFFAKKLSLEFDYMNWDVDKDRSRILAQKFGEQDLWIFDEIHKYKKWRNFLKGVFDGPTKKKILVTGSAKLDTLRKGGDSLQGRYFYHRLLPLSVAELGIGTNKDLEELLSLGGFPEPFFKSSKTFANRWSRLYRERVVRQEVATQEQIQDLASLELLYNRLPDVVGSLLSINSLAEGLQNDHKTVARWLNTLENLYSFFRLSPLSTNKIRALKKAQKIYFYDWNAVLEEGARFENFVATHVLKWVCHSQDSEGRNLDLRYYRDRNDREVDLVVTENNHPTLILEVKTSDQDSNRGIRYLKSKFPKAQALQVFLKGKKSYIDGHGIHHLSALELLKTWV